MPKKKTTLRYDTLTDNESVYRARQKGLLRESSRSYRLIDLFAGAGGLTLGFTKSLGQVFVPVWANDFNAYAARTYNAKLGDHCAADYGVPQTRLRAFIIGCKFDIIVKSVDGIVEAA